MNNNGKNITVPRYALSSGHASVLILLLVIIAVGGFIGYTYMKRNPDKGIGGITVAVTPPKTPVSAESDDVIPNIVERTRAQWRHLNDTKWTDENIRKFPVDYFKDQIMMHGKTLDALEGCIFTLTKEHDQAQREATQKATEVEERTSALAEIVAAYRKAIDSNSWPLIVQGVSFSQERALEKIEDADDVIGSLTEDRDEYQEMATEFEENLKEFRQVKRELVNLKPRLERGLARAKAGEIISDLGAVKSTIRNIPTTTFQEKRDSVDFSTPNTKAKREQNVDKILDKYSR